MKRMTEDQIPAFVRDIADTGCNITAVLGGAGYVIGDADLPEGKYEEVAPRLREISEEYGGRDHLLAEIAAYLISIGRCYPPPQLH